MAHHKNRRRAQQAAREALREDALKAGMSPGDAEKIASEAWKSQHEQNRPTWEQKAEANLARTGDNVAAGLALVGTAAQVVPVYGTIIGGACLAASAATAYGAQKGKEHEAEIQESRDFVRNAASQIAANLPPVSEGNLVNAAAIASDASETPEPPSADEKQLLELKAQYSALVSAGGFEPYKAQELQMRIFELEGRINLGAETERPGAVNDHTRQGAVSPSTVSVQNLSPNWWGKLVSFYNTIKEKVKTKLATLPKAGAKVNENPANTRIGG